MGVSKTDLFTENQNQLALYAKAFSHPARVAILQYLFQLNACVCGDLVEEIGLSQPTISQHLKELKTIGLIKGTVDGTSVCYCIDADNWEKMKAALADFLDQDCQKISCCE